MPGMLLFSPVWVVWLKGYKQCAVSSLASFVTPTVTGKGEGRAYTTGLEGCIARI